MAQVTLGGNPVNTIGSIPEVGSTLPDFDLVNAELGSMKKSDFAGKRVVLNVFPSIDTGTCATSTRKFNEFAANLENTTVVCVSHDLPFAQKRFCGAEGIENVAMASDFRGGAFGKAFGLEFSDGPLAGLHSRVVIVADENGKVVHAQQVPEIADEPDYDAALASLK